MGVVGSAAAGSASDVIDGALGHGDGELDPIGDAELVQQGGDVSLDGAGTDDELLGDLAVTQALRHEQGDLALPVGDGLGKGAALRGSIDGRLDEPVQDGAGEGPLAVGGGVHGAEDDLGGAVLEQEAGGAGT